MRSDQVKQGLERMPNRALIHAAGVTREQMQKPFIGVCSSFTDLIPGHIGMRSLERKIEWGVCSGGGVPFLFSVPKMAFFKCGDVRLMLAAPETPEFDHPASIIYYRVDDIRAAHAALGERGVVFETEPSLVHETERSRLWMVYFRDPEGNVLALMCEKSKA